MPALILMYHDVCENFGSVVPGHRPYVLNPSDFHRQMDVAGSTGLPVLNVSEWCAPHRPPRALVLTFDDGHVSNHDVALPILVEHWLKATFFIVAGRIGKGETMGWKQLRTLHAAGMEIGSHTMTHRQTDQKDHRLLSGIPPET